MSSAQHFAFSSAAFDDQVAHHGDGIIEAARVLSRDQGCLRFIDLVLVPPGCTIGSHRHDADEEVYVVVSGHGSMTLDGTQFAVDPGDVIVNRPGGTHGLANTGDDALRLVVIDVVDDLAAPAVSRVDDDGFV